MDTTRRGKGRRMRDSSICNNIRPPLPHKKNLQTTLEFNLKSN